MTEPKQDVTISAGTPPGATVNQKALNLLASLSTSSVPSKDKTGKKKKISGGGGGGGGLISSVSLDNKTTVAMSPENSSPTSSTGSARNTTSSKTIKRKLEEHNKTTFSTTTNKKSKKSKKNKKKKSSSSSSSEQKDARKSPFVSATKTKTDQSSSSSLMSRLLQQQQQQQQGGMTSRFAGASGAGGIFNTSTAAASAAAATGLSATTNNNNGILDMLQSSSSSAAAASAAAAAAAGGNNAAFDSYLQERLAAIRGGSVSGSAAAATASLGGIGAGAAGGSSVPGLGMTAPSSSPTLASIMAARRSNQLTLMLQMEEYERSLYGLGGGLPGTGGLGGAGGAPSMLYGRLGLDNGLGLGGHNSYAALTGGGLSSGFPGLTAGSHLADMANFQSLRSSALMGGMSAAEQWEALRARGAVPGQASSIGGTDKLSALAMTAVATSGGSAAKNAPGGGKASDAAKRSLGPARGKSKQARKTNDEKANSSVDSDPTENDQYYQRFRGYQCEQWTEKFNDLVNFKTTHGHCQVPHAYKENVGLARWVKRQRYQYKLMMENKQSTMTSERVRLLEDIGFIWDSHASTWEDRLNELKEYAAVHGNCNVPSSYSGNPKLATWIKCQRRQYKLLQEGRTSNMTLERMKELEKIGFKWRVQP
eukprot:CAMPEP_0113451656 /NCGR_PEP_ID=MMETSP0014_2-20120614/6449_1 /TAXON_ID=2857 /ORGANISM="Nitzschia sp." /LENGTH=649 /DNA_ID=CAMNT_0000343015 /DNA_START=363 /DNA_END=2312 /DNA_ORIENTATION=- /assembly_acc=CAM_ASM_000159